jgi:DNA-binding MarR family transcriptional regulator
MCACARYYYVRAHASGNVSRMADGRRELAAEAWGALLQVHATLVPAMDRRLRREVGMPLGWYDVLLELQAAPERRLTMSQLGERVVLSRTRVSRVVDDMVNVDLVIREANPADARSAFAVLTAHGLAEFRRAAPTYLAAIDSEFARALKLDELRQLRTLLRRVRDHGDLAMG